MWSQDWEGMANGFVVFKMFSPVLCLIPKLTTKEYMDSEWLKNENETVEDKVTLKALLKLKKG